jgi:hypothetical protein
MVGDTANVITAVVDWPGASLVPAWFHVMATGPLALVGFQLEVAMFKDKDTPKPVFLMYIVRVMFPPGVNVPQLIVVRFVWQLLSE